MSEAADHLLAVRMSELARTLAVPRALDKILFDVSMAAIDLIPGVGTAGILLIGRAGKFESIGGTDDMPQLLDALQMKYHEGPCVQAALADVVVRTDDFRTEERWPRYSAEVVKLGVLSGLSFKLYTADRTAGALNLFGFEPGPWDIHAETVGTVLAAHAAAAILANQQGTQLEAALLTRDRIAQAKGIVMERFGVDAVRAFEMLRQLSQERNVKLIDIAQQVIDTCKR